MSKKFKICGVGIDTESINLPIGPTDGYFQYVHTTIGRNNEHCIDEYVKSLDSSYLMTTIDFISDIEDIIGDHLSVLGRDCIDLLFLDSGINLPDGFDTTNLLAGDFGIRNPKSIEQIKEFSEKLGKPIKYVGLDLCPIHFNKVLVDYCIKEDIQIFGFNPLGGRFSSGQLIDSFSVPYLLSFASYYCSVVMLSGKDMFLAGESQIFLNNLINLDVFDEKQFEMKSSIDKLNKPLKKIVNTSLVIGEGILITYDNSELLFDPSSIRYLLSKKNSMIIPRIPTKTEERTAIESEIDDLVSGLKKFTENNNLSSEFHWIKYKIINTIKSLYPENSRYTFTRLSDTILGISVDRPNLSKVVKVSNFMGKSWKKKNKISYKNSMFLLGLFESGSPIFLETVKDEDVDL